MQKKILGLAMAGLLLSGCSVKTAITTTAETTTAPTTTATTTVTETTTTATETTTTTPVTTTAAYEVMDYDFSAVTLAAQEAAEGQEEITLTSGTAKALGVELQVTGAEEDRILITLINQKAKSLRVVIPAYQVDGLYVNTYHSWKLGPEEVLETELVLPEYALCWLGRESVNHLVLESMAVSPVTDVAYAVEAEKVENIEIPLGGELKLGKVPTGAVLCDAEGANLTVLGVDYADPENPALVLQLKASEAAEDEETGKDDKTRVLYAQAEVIAVNGAKAEGQAEMFLPKGEMAVEILQPAFVMQEEMTEVQSIGKVESVTVRYVIREGQVGAVIAEGEVTLPGEKLEHWRSGASQ